ncbi:MAG: methyltransferase domain-containing protein [Bdellovibrionota bacterium]
MAPSPARHLETVPVEIPVELELKLICRRLMNGASVDDHYFDRIFPPWARFLSHTHWTPMPVIQRATQLLTGGRPDPKILDAGSGVGKFCIAGALMSRGRFFGVEQRPTFVNLGRALVSHHEVERVTLIQANLLEIDWSEYDAIYLFNPFLEHLLPRQSLDKSIELDETFYRRYVRHTERQLQRMPQGARVVTYHGFGGTFPESYTRLVREHCHRGPLEFWIKTNP